MDNAVKDIYWFKAGIAREFLITYSCHALARFHSYEYVLCAMGLYETAHFEYWDGK